MFLVIYTDLLKTEEELSTPLCYRFLVFKVVQSIDMVFLGNSKFLSSSSFKLFYKKFNKFKHTKRPRRQRRMKEDQTHYLFTRNAAGRDQFHYVTVICYHRNFKYWDIKNDYGKCHKMDKFGLLSKHASTR